MIRAHRLVPALAALFLSLPAAAQQAPADRL
jgi:hypothetical protein